MKTRVLSSPTARATLAAGSHEPAILYRGIPTAVAVALLAAVGAPASSAGGSAAPSWEKVDPARKRVALDIVAAFNANNSGLNFNGYYRGDMTLAVPAGWTVDIDFRNNDAVLPHSLASSHQTVCAGSLSRAGGSAGCRHFQSLYKESGGRHPVTLAMRSTWFVCRAATEECC
jgi:hypothetical protein